MRCPECGNKPVKRGHRKLADGRKVQRYFCRKCNIFFSDAVLFGNPKILYFDIETSYIVGGVWKAGKTFLRPDYILQDWFMLSWAAKWLCDDYMYSYVCAPKEVEKADDSRIVKQLWNLLDEADVVVGHNSRNFDIRKANWKFLLYDMQPPSYYKTVDTLTEARRYFSPASCSLDYLAKSLGVGGKIKNRNGLWNECVNGDRDALVKLREYNENDVLIGESVYLKMRPWMRNHPNMGQYYETTDLRCKNCGSLQVETGGIYRAPVQMYVSWRCKCGAQGRTDQRFVIKDKQLAK